jgi:Uma2 family endonuclease
VVEVVSPNDRWTLVNDKVQAYLAAGVRLVWLVDPRREAVEVYTAEGTAHRLTAAGANVLSGGDVLPGFELPLTDLFSAA